MDDAERVPDAVLLQPLAIVGRTNSGKTFTAKRFVERLLDAGRRVCILDPTDVWWGLRSNAAGDKPGYPVVVFGGEHGDLPIGERSAVPLARMIAETNMPAVISLAEFSMGGRHRFAADFLQELHRLNRRPLHLVIDEADELAPQNPMAEAKFSLHQVDRIVRRGRVRGFRVMLISQRPAVLHKNVLTQANTLIAMRLPAPQDRKAIEAWIVGQADIDLGREVLASLSALQRGTGWVWAPDAGILEKVNFPRISTFDSSRSPEDDETIDAPRQLAPVNLDAIRTMLGAAEPEPSVSVALSAAASFPEAIAAMREDGLQEGYVQGLTEGRAETPKAITAMQDLLDYVGKAARDIDEAIIAYQTGDVRPDRAPATREPVTPPSARTPMAAPLPLAARANGAHAPRRSMTAVADLPAYEAGMLAVLASAHPARRTERAWAVLAGRSSRSSSWSAARKALSSLGLVERSAGLWGATQAGVARAGKVEKMPTEPRALREAWKARLSRIEATLIDGLVGSAKTRPELSHASGYSATSSSFSAAIASLRKNGLILEDRGRMRLVEELYG